MKLARNVGDESAELLDLGDLVERVVAERARTLSPQIQLVVEIASNVAQVHGVRRDLERLVGSLLELWLAPVAGAGGVGIIVETTEDEHGIRLEVVSMAKSSDVRPLPPSLEHGDSLRVVLGVVGQHEGTLRVASQPEGSTRLEIVFPIPRATELLARCRRPTRPLPITRARRIH
ncbi:hypothetical protein BH11MYX3_BH11MYX3_42810 [soil metagenome]